MAISGLTNPQFVVLSLFFLMEMVDGNGKRRVVDNNKGKRHARKFLYIWNNEPFLFTPTDND